MPPGTIAKFHTLGSTELKIVNLLTGLRGFDFNYEKDIFPLEYYHGNIQFSLNITSLYWVRLDIVKKTVALEFSNNEC